MMMMKKVVILASSLFMFMMIACSSDSDSGGNGDNYDRTQLTDAWINDLLLPAITDLETKLQALNTSTATFNTLNNPEEELEKLRVDWLAAYKTWQHVHVFLFETDYAVDMNSFPIDEDELNLNIQIVDNTTISFQFERKNDTQGFPAVDYLINGIASSNAEIISLYQNDENYINYLSFITARMLTTTQEIKLELETESSSNVNDVANNLNSYFNQQINDILQFTEAAFRERKIATPSGARQSQRSATDIANGKNFDPKPDFVEARFSSDNSKALYTEAFTAIQNVYFGRKYSDGSDTEGIQDYLQFLGSSILLEGNNNDIFLDDYIISLFTNIENSNNTITDNFYDQTQDYNTNFDSLFVNIQEFVVTFKGNVLSAFNITIDFADNDGD